MSVEQLQPAHSPLKTVDAFAVTSTLLTLRGILFRRLGYQVAWGDPIHARAIIPRSSSILTLSSIALGSTDIRIQGGLRLLFNVAKHYPVAAARVSLFYGWEMAAAENFPALNLDACRALVAKYQSMTLKRLSCTCARF
jgi:hypothetical protein